MDDSDILLQLQEVTVESQVKKPRKRKYKYKKIDKDDPNYSSYRVKNNIASRNSRIKSNIKLKESVLKVQLLTELNTSLKKELETVNKNLEICQHRIDYLYELLISTRK